MGKWILDGSEGRTDGEYEAFTGLHERAGLNRIPGWDADPQSGPDNRDYLVKVHIISI